MRNEGNDGYIGFIPDLMAKISKKTNFQFTWIEYDKYGYEGRNGNWNGMIAGLIDKAVRLEDKMLGEDLIGISSRTTRALPTSQRPI
jgi:hypothetical protein